jgi:hypothetical protein
MGLGPATESPQDRQWLLERVDRLCASLSPLSRRKRRAGWSPEAAALLGRFEQVRDRLQDPNPLHKRQLPDDVQTMRCLDAWAIDIFSDSRPLGEAFDLSRELRRVARGSM